MSRRALLLTVLIASACSSQSGGQTNAQSGMTKSGVPRNSPLEPDIKNIPATTGRANRPLTPAPFAIAQIGKFDQPFAMAFLPGGSLLVTEKAGRLKLRLADGTVQYLSGVPAVATGGQGGLLDVAPAPDFATSRHIYLTYAAGASGNASELALAIATLAGPVAKDSGPTPPPIECSAAPCPPAHLEDVRVIWRSGSVGPGGQFGANILFSPDGKYLFLSSGERQRFTPAQDPNQALGKILRLTLDGKAAPGNPMYGKGGVEAMTWSTGHRNPYGMVFTPDGRLWEEEMGPRGGDELNLILPGKNYGWPVVSNGDNYSGQPIPDHPSRPDFEAPKLWWNPSVSPAGMILYSGSMFPQYRGSLLMCAMSEAGLARITLNGDVATPAEFWDFGTRLRDIAQAPDGSIWLLEDGGKGAGGRLLRLTPKA